ncbi:hypothetical protein CHS0354_023973 [Potamilus streckersoni]|uniref:Anthranilate synthase component 1 n=1 Tax=Potamilus streckersoni TaxID=2493646 RepID=A0AAE0RZ66_9BIVA|nr:hypothetical protein CHS0354_023973 [Potamilus streckersoni]
MTHVTIIFNGVHDDYYALAPHPPAIQLDDLSKYEIDVIAKAISTKHKITLLPFTGNILILMRSLEHLKPDAVFNLFEGLYLCAKSEPFVPLVLETLNIPYTGAPSIQTPAWQVFYPNDAINISIKSPFIVKPEHEDASIGITKDSVAHFHENAIQLITRIWEELKQPAIIESFITGREFNVAILGDSFYEQDPSSVFAPKVLPISEIDFSNLPTELPPIVTYNGKWVPESLEYKATKPICPAQISPLLETSLKQIATRTFHALGCRDYARVDFRVTPQNQIYVIDVNPNPDLSKEAGFNRVIQFIKVVMIMVLTSFVGTSCGGGSSVSTAEKQMKKGNNKKAIEILNEGIKGQDSTNPKAFAFLARAYYAERNYEMAASSIAKAKGMGLSGNDLSDMEIIFNALWGIVINNAIVKYNQALEMIRGGKKEQASSLLDSAQASVETSITIRPDSTLGYTVLANVYVVKEQFEKAAEILNKSININPNDLQSYIQLSNIYTQYLGVKDSTKKQEAITILEKARKKFGDKIEIIRQLAIAYVGNGMSDLAEDVTKKLVELAPKDKYANYLYGIVLGTLAEKGVPNKYDESLDAYQKVIDLAPDFEEAVYNYAYVSFRKAEDDYAMNAKKFIEDEMKKAKGKKAPDIIYKGHFPALEGAIQKLKPLAEKIKTTELMEWNKSAPPDTTDIYKKIKSEYGKSALLESSDVFEPHNSHSYIGFSTLASIVFEKRSGHYCYPDKSIRQFQITKKRQPIEELKLFIATFKFEYKVRPPFALGFLGYFTYDIIENFEDVTLTKHDELGIPKLQYDLFSHHIVFDHYKQKIYMVSFFWKQNEMPNNKTKILHDEVCMKIVEKLKTDSNPKERARFRVSDIEVRSNTDDEYLSMVQFGKKHCFRGDVFQVVLSRRYSLDYEGDEFRVYCELKKLNPSPYLFFFNYGTFRLFGSSPEAQLLVSAERVAEIHPIAGTFKRSKTKEEDEIDSKRLLADPKERAEHVMLVDLARNDLSISCEDVKVDSFMQVQLYSHVIHLTSKVKGRLSPEKHVLDLLADTFPAGTLSGAPKIRAMQIINEQEKHARSFYAGSVGVIGIDGTLIQAIMIRSFMCKDNRIYFQAGAGITSQSVPESELEEISNKLGALRKAINQACTEEAKKSKC